MQTSDGTENKASEKKNKKENNNILRAEQTATPCQVILFLETRTLFYKQTKKFNINAKKISSFATANYQHIRSKPVATENTKFEPSLFCH